MAVTIKYTFPCLHDACPGEASVSVLDLSQHPGDTITVDVDLNLSQTDFVCDTCGHLFSSGDFVDDLLDVLADEGGECAGVDEDEDDEE